MIKTVNEEAVRWVANLEEGTTVTAGSLDTEAFYRRVERQRTTRQQGNPQQSGGQREPVGLTEAFAQDARKQVQWKAFLTQSVGVENQALSLREVIVFLAEFLLPILKAIRTGATWESAWPPSGP